MPSHCTRRVLEKLALGSSLLALMGATVVGEQVWENDSPIPCLLESSKGMWEHNPPLGVIQVEFRISEEVLGKKLHEKAEGRKAQNVDESG